MSVGREALLQCGRSSVQRDASAWSLDDHVRAGNDRAGASAVTQGLRRSRSENAIGDFISPRLLSNYAAVGPRVPRSYHASHLHLSVH